jgi:surfeit locus 1 family protein
MKNILTIISSITAFIILISLGTWQLNRLTWKSDIIEQLNTVYAINAEENILSFDDLKITNNDLPILYGSVEGKFDYSREILVGPRPFEGDIGYNVVTPLTLKNGGTVLVNRGFIATEQKDQASSTHPKGRIKISGLIRKPDWNSFTPENSPENNVWTKLDITQIAKAKNIRSIAPLMVYAEKSSKDFGILQMQPARWVPRNKHQQYAIFWFTMAGVFLGLIGIYAYTQKQERTIKI